MFKKRFGELYEKNVLIWEKSMAQKIFYTSKNFHIFVGHLHFQDLNLSPPTPMTIDVP